MSIVSVIVGKYLNNLVNRWEIYLDCWGYSEGIVNLNEMSLSRVILVNFRERERLLYYWG